MEVNIGYINLIYLLYLIIAAFVFIILNCSLVNFGLLNFHSTYLLFIQVWNAANGTSLSGKYSESWIYKEHTHEVVDLTVHATGKIEVVNIRANSSNKGRRGVIIVVYHTLYNCCNYCRL